MILKLVSHIEPNIQLDALFLASKEIPMCPVWTRDAEDIEICIKKFKLTKKELESRAELIIYPGNEDRWKETLNRVVKEFT